MQEYKYVTNDCSHLWYRVDNFQCIKLIAFNAKYCFDKAYVMEAVQRYLTSQWTHLVQFYFWHIGLLKGIKVAEIGFKGHETVILL